MYRPSRIIQLIFAAFILTVPPLSIACSADEFVRPSQEEIQKEVSNINAAIQAKGAKWVAGETSMTRLSPTERKARLGVFIPPPDRTAPISGAGVATEADTLIQTVVSSAPTGVLDWRNYGGGKFKITSGNYVTPIRDQQQCGDCWAFGSVAALESRTLMTMNTPGVDLDLSEQVLLSCDLKDEANGDGCSGGNLVTKFFVDTGVPVESCYPYTQAEGSCGYACSNYWSGIGNYKITGYKWIANYWGRYFGVAQTRPTVNGLRNALYSYGPIVVAFEVFDDFDSYTSGIYSHTWGSDQGAHAVLLVGYDDNNKCFIVKNCWGPNWGESGFFRIAYSQVGAVPTVNHNNWVFKDPFFGGYALAYDGARPGVLYTDIKTPVNNSYLSRKVNGTRYRIKGTANTDSLYLEPVGISTDGGSTWPTATDTSKGTWTTWRYEWTLPTIDNKYVVESEVMDNNGNRVTSTPVTVLVDSTPPSSEITAPATGSALNVTTYAITGTASDNLAGVAKVEVSTNGGSTWHLATDTSGNGTWTTWNYSWALRKGNFIIKSRAIDLAGNVEKSGTGVSVTVSLPLL